MKAIYTSRSESVMYRTETLERYLHDILKETKIDPKLERELLVKAQQGDEESRDKLIKSNLKFVVAIAKEHQRRDVELIDLVSAGNVGLVEAVEKYDLSKDVKFLSCAVWWIRARMIEHVQEAGYLVSLPLNRYNEVLKVNKHREKLYAKDGIEYTDEQIAEMYPDIKASYLKGSAECMAVATSIDLPIGEGEDTIAQMLPSTLSTMDDILGKESKKALLTSINRLPEQQRRVLMLTYGFETGEEMSTTEVAKEIGRTVDSVRELKRKACLTLKEDESLVRSLI